MAENTISRKVRDFDITLHTATASATTLDMRDVAGAIVVFGTMSTNASTLQMWVSCKHWRHLSPALQGRRQRG